MSDTVTLPVVSDTNESVSISTHSDLDSWKLMVAQAKTLVASGMLPATINKPEKAIAIMMKGKELGLPPMLSFAHIHIIDGKPTISSEMMLSLIYKAFPKAHINFVRMDNDACEIDASRPNGQITKFTFSIDDAKSAGLADRGPWKKYTRAMLRSRCVSEMARVLFPDVVLGCYTPDELISE